MDKPQLEKAWLKVVAKAWADEEFRLRLLEAPEQVLAAEGVELPAGKTVRVVAAAHGEALFVLPPMPGAQGGPATEEERITPLLFF